jgi:outer membrane lipoprotein-sorting protein
MQNRKRIVSILLTFIILAGSTVAIAAFMIPDANDLLLQALEMTETITDGHAVIELTVDTPEQDGSGTIEVWSKLDMGPNGEPGFRAEILNASEAEMVGVTAVADGTQFWLYHPGENTVLLGTFAELHAKIEAAMANSDFDSESYKHEIPEEYAQEFDSENMPETPEEAVAKLLEFFTADRTSNTQIGDSNTYTVRLIPIPEQMPDEVRAVGGFLNVWIRTDDSAPLGIEYAEGSLGYAKAVATTLELNQGIDDAVFTFDIPEGAEVINIKDLEHPNMPDQEAALEAFEVLTATAVPDGAVANGELVMRGAVVQRYSLTDGKSFTVAQGPASAAAGLFDGEPGTEITVRGVDGSVFADEENGRSLLTWVENDVTFWIGGDITVEQALSIAESLD